MFPRFPHKEEHNIEIIVVKYGGFPNRVTANTFVRYLCKYPHYTRTYVKDIMETRHRNKFEIQFEVSSESDLAEHISEVLL